MLKTKSAGKDCNSSMSTYKKQKTFDQFKITKQCLKSNTYLKEQKVRFSLKKSKYESCVELEKNQYLQKVNLFHRFINKI